MTTPQSGERDTRALGLVADPFLVVDDGSADSAGINLAIRSAALGLLSAVDASTREETHKPIIIEKTEDVAAYFPVAALSTVMQALVDGIPSPRTIPAYIPLDMMRLGRVRALLAEMAERVAGKDPDLVIAAWSRRVLADPDTTMPEWDALVSSGFDAQAVLDEIDADPVAFSARVFGEKLMSREGSDDFESLMRVSTARLDKLDTDPETDSADLAPADEDNSEDPLSEVFTQPLGEMDEEALTEGVGDNLPALLLGDYITAYTHTHLSPVIARGIRAYRAQGFASMSEELKITKAPTKTLLALFDFAKGVYDLGVVVYDRVEMWEGVPQDLRSKIVGTLTEMRWNLKDSVVMVIILIPGMAPEIEEGFGSATRISWRFTEIEKVSAFDAPFDIDIARSWMASASLSDTPEWAEAALTAIPEGTTLDLACRALSRAIGDAVVAGATQVDPALVLAALAAEKEVAAP